MDEKKPVQIPYTLWQIFLIVSGSFFAGMVCTHLAYYFIFLSKGGC